MDDALEILKINSIEEYIDITQDLEQKNYWFRGQPCASFQLLPSLLRYKKYAPYGSPGDIIVMPYELPDERTAVEKLQKYLQQTTPCSFIQAMYKAQHNGLPTRLLDFTSDKFVALYFSVNNPVMKIEDDENSIYDLYDLEYNDNYVAVFCLDPLYLNKNTQQKNKIFKIDELDADFIYKNDLPIAIEPEYEDIRLRAQASRFVIFGVLQWHLDYISIFRKFALKKILIHKNICNDIFIKLRKIGYSHNTMFPDTEGFIKEIKLDMMNNYKPIIN